MNDRPDEAVQGGYRLDDQIGYVLRLASQRHAAIFQNLSVMKLTPTQFSALVRIAEVGECSQNHLGRLTAMDVATIKGVIDRLGKKELVALNADPADRRRTLISLTDKAAVLIAELHRVGRMITEETLAPLNSSERRRLLQLLRKIA
ncbi:MarR family winged helix-turn-helix transcriptional regulator [Aliiroseovarius sp. YM-037]|uniref:MarR family winged helix-turn-helix transcriptional regulator n=1 Tax=Aliiroseovarius sp. YM-037 TaxID=3341728 RepID=UPI003A80FBF4